MAQASPKSRDGSSDEEDFIPRPYQAQLYEQAKDGNSILFLPTGTGKTMIAMMLIKNKSEALKLPYEQGGKRIVINVPTKSLAEQHRNTFRTTISCLSEYHAEVFTGDDIDENWSKAFWYPKICATHVLIMPGEVHRSLITHNLLPLDRVELIIFDECHHANQDKNHPYVLIMDEVRKMTANKPQIFGMTPCIINKQCDPSLILEEVKKLQKSLDNAKVITSDDIHELNRYGATPDIEPPIDFDPASSSDEQDSQFLAGYLKALEQLDSFLDQEYLSQVVKKFKSLLLALRCSIESMGLWAVHQLSQTVSDDIASFIQTNSAQNRSECAAVSRIKEIVDDYIPRLNSRLQNEPDEYKRLIKFASPKMRALLHCLADYSPINSPGRVLRGIIFVQEKKNVFLICMWLKKVAEALAHWSFLRVGYVVGQTSTISNIKSSRNSQKNVLDMFRSGQLNLIISTSVLEEGIDVPQCNLVARYDFPATFREFIQSKGRARSPGSRFLIFVPLDGPLFAERTKNLELLQAYIDIEKSLETIHKKPKWSDAYDHDIGYEGYLKNKYNYYTPAHAHLTHNSAISVVNRYCSSLPSDSISNSTPKVDIIEIYPDSVDIGSNRAELTANDVFYQCLIRLPINSPLRAVIYGDTAKTKKVAKKLAAFQACIELHKLQELDDNLLPIGKKNIQTLCDHLGLEPYEEEYLETERDKRLGTTKSRHTYTKLTANIFSGSSPAPKQPCYLYIIAMRLSAPLPDHLNTRGTRLFDPALRDTAFAIILPRLLPDICDFKIYTRSGEVTVTLIKSPYSYRMQEEVLDKLAHFHRYIFHSFLQIVPSEGHFDKEEARTNYLVVPVKWTGEWSEASTSWSPNISCAINWTIIDQIYSLKTDHVTKTNQPYLFDANKFADAVVKRVYYNNSSQQNDAFYVIKIDYDKNPLSRLDDSNGKKALSQNYCTYNKKKYSVDIMNLDQPLLDVDYVSPHLNLLTCRFDEESRSTRKEGKGRSRCFLVPELCTIHPLPAGYCRLAFMLPSILYRLDTIYRAEQLRSIIAQETKVGPACFTKWPMIDSPDQLDPQAMDPSDKSSSQSSPSSDSNQVTPPSANAIGLMASSLSLAQGIYASRAFSGPSDKELGIELSKAFCKSISPYYEESIYSTKRKQENIASGDESIANSTQNHAAGFGELLPGFKRQKLQSVTQCALKFDEHKDSMSTSLGPNPNDILRALTLVKAGESMNLERLEMIGDSFLKYAVSVFTFCSSRVHEGLLSELRSRQSSNYHLFRLGKRKNIPGYMIASKFDPKCNWLPPGFCVDDDVAKSTSVSSFTWQEIPDKSIADCVEALIGAYLINSGCRGALYFMKWLGLKVMYDGDEAICNPNPNDPVWHHMPPVPSPINGDLDSATRDALIDKLYKQTSLDQFERSVLRYEFRDKAFLIQAFTHSSYFENQLTDCYQRLEFLGDAILDYLVTRVLYEDSRKHSPGILTDLRSALVNNTFFASLAVEYQFHKYLKNTSHDLYRVIDDFVNSSLAKEASASGSMGLCDLYRANASTIAHCESETLLGDVEVPKALGDIFESVAGAIFLDSGMSLDEVWRVYYPMMKPEIDHFADNIPKSPIRELFESRPNGVKFLKSVVSPGAVEISVMLSDEQKKFTAVKSTKKAAKLEAAKLALQYIKSNAI